MAIKPTKPTVPPAPSRSNPGTDFSTKADTFAAFQTTLATYMDATADFVDAQADAALAAATAAGAADGLDLTGRALNMTRVNAAATALEFRTPAQVLADLGVTATAAEINAVDGVTATGTAVIRAADAAAARAAIGAGRGLQLGTAVTSTGATAIDFTGIPAGANRITVMLLDVSTSGSDAIIAQLGGSGGFETTGYVSAVSTGSSFSSAASTAGIVIARPGAAASIASGAVTLSRIDANTWLGFGGATDGFTSGTGVSFGSKPLSGTLDRIRITTQGGTDTFDAGLVNIHWEF